MSNADTEPKYQVLPEYTDEAILAATEGRDAALRAVAELLPYAWAGAEALEAWEPYGPPFARPPGLDPSEAASAMLARIKAGEFGEVDRGQPGTPRRGRRTPVDPDWTLGDRVSDMSSLAAYLRARLDEDEATARARLAELPSPWLVERDRRNGGWQVVTQQGFIVAREDDGGLSEEHARWIAATADPGRALAEITAKRAVVRHHSAEYAPLVADTHCPACGDMMPCPTLRYLAQPHASRPDFDPAWRLEAAGD